MNHILNLQRTPRTYEPAWKLLRQKKFIVLEIEHPLFLERIKRMICKEKDMDTGFKLINELERPRLRFKYNANNKELEVRLVGKLGLMDVKG